MTTVTTAQTSSASTTAPILMSHAAHEGTALRLTMWKRGSRFCPFDLLMGFTSVGFGHKQTELFLGGSPRVNESGYLAGVYDEDSVAQLEQNVKILADEDNGDALFFLFVEQVVYKIR